MSRTARRAAPPRRQRSARQRAYRALLRDPRWQKRRLEVLSRDQWRCRQCGASDKELQVHHRLYVAGCAPWEVPLAALVTLCTACHGRQHGRKRH